MQNSHHRQAVQDQSMNKMASDFEQAHSTVCQLIDVFEQGEATYMSPSYQESRARADHIDKLFKALGWDVNHDTQTNPYEQEVKIETAVKTGAAKRRADYAFSIAPWYQRPIFFVEAKRPQSNIETADNYFQVIRYSWNTQLPIAVLTDFRTFHIVDARHKPSLHTALSRKIKVFHYKQLRDREAFAEIYWLFSREACISGSIAKYVQTLADTAKTGGSAYQAGLFAGGYQSIDDLFLEQLDEYRETLARTFKSANTNLTGPQLTEMVQRTLDRLVFLRFLEDKLIEPEPIVRKLALSKSPWKEFVQESARLNTVYNGIVFKPHSILDRAGFLTDCQDFQQICEELSASDSPYDFNHIPVEILGRIYERFLGKVVTATAKRARVEDKPAAKIAGGVFYTPDWVVQFMAEKALAPMLSGKSPSDILKLRIIDTSCGSGSFLIGAFDVLLRHLGKSYFASPGSAKAGEWIQQDGEYRVSLKKKREVLVSCLYGVDIDAQAAEVAQLSLYLKLLEEETTATARTGQLEFQEAILPTLSRNVLVGNSLAFSKKQDSALDLFSLDALSASSNAIDIRQAFSRVTEKEGGFDLVIGNPPYIKEYTNKAAFDGLRESPYYQGKMDLWYMFACRALDVLKPGRGRLALIATNNWVTNAGAKKLRDKIVEDARIELLIDFGEFMVFRDASVQTMILVAKRDTKPASYTFDYRRLEKHRPTLADAQALVSDQAANPSGEVRLFPKINRASLKGKPFTFSDVDSETLLEKLAKQGNFKLQSDEIAQGIVPNPDVLTKKALEKYSDREVQKLSLKAGMGVFAVPKGHFSPSAKVGKYLMPLLEPQDVSRYVQRAPARLELIYASKKWTDQSPLPAAIIDHLRPFKKILDERRETASGSIEWFNLHWPRAPHFFEEGERILAVRKCATPTFALVSDPFAVMMAFNVIKTGRVDMRYLVALFNSNLAKFWLRKRGKMQGSNFQVDKEPLLEVPIRIPSKGSIEAISKLVNFIQEAARRRDSASTDTQRDGFQRRMDEADEEIQKLIFDIYALTNDERKFLESAS